MGIFTRSRGGICKHVLHRHHARQIHKRIPCYEAWRPFPDPYGNGYHRRRYRMSDYPLQPRFCNRRIRNHRSWMRTDISLHHSYDARRVRKRQITSDDRSSNGIRLHWLLNNATLVRIYCGAYLDLPFAPLSRHIPRADIHNARACHKGHEGSGTYRENMIP